MAVSSAVSSVSPSLPWREESAHQVARLAIEAVPTTAPRLRTVLYAWLPAAHVRQHSGTPRLRICASALVMAFRRAHDRSYIRFPACCRLNMRDVHHRTDWLSVIWTLRDIHLGFWIALTLILRRRQVLQASETLF
jgi:hypothetical protein